MRNSLIFLSLLCTLSLGVFAGEGLSIAGGNEKAPSAEKMVLQIKGEIASMDYGYIIRGKTPSEIFTILNPNPEILEHFVAQGKEVELEVQVVTGDNVNIMKIDGQKY